jgi:phenylacetate-CoA ligase
VYPDQRSTLEDVFGARVFSWYGHSERLILGGECEYSSSYHHFPDYGVMELADADGAIVGEPGAQGELVGTTLSNRSMPLLRYRTGDHARLLSSRCDCGRNFQRFDEVVGHRGQDCVIGRHGSQISLAALNMHGPIFDEVLRFQYRQGRPGILEIVAIVSPRFTESHRQALLQAYTRKVGVELDVTFRAVDDIPLTPRGKWKMLVLEGEAGSRARNG